MQQSSRGSMLHVLFQVAPSESEQRELGLEQYRFTGSYSVYCPEGELDDIHVSSIDRILLPEEFETAKQRGWREK